MGFRKRATGRPSISWPEAVDEALCFGWIDGVRKRLDDDSYVIRFTPRKPSSHWSNVNVRRFGVLSKEGRVRPAGVTAFELRSEDRTGRASYERTEEAVLDPDHEKRFRADKGAWRWFEAQAPWYRRTAIHWVISAKKQETRDRRLDTLIESSRAGRAVPPLSRPDRKA